MRWRGFPALATGAILVFGFCAFAEPTTTLPVDGTCPNCDSNTISDLQKIIDAARTKSFGEVGNAVAKHMDAEHDALLAKRGCGTLIGIHAGDPPAGTHPPPHVTDCTTFVLDVLRETFAAQGRSADFDRVFATAERNSGSGGFKGTELMKALQSELGWKGMFWAGDLKADAETTYANYLQKKKGTYYGIKVNPAEAVTGFKTAPIKPGDNYDRLTKVPFALLTTKGGMHMGLVLNGKLYEVHWANGCDSNDVIADSDFKDWIWSAGAIVMPPDEEAAAFGGRR